MSIIENSQAKVGDTVKIRGQDYPSQTNIGKLELRNVANDQGLELTTVTDIGTGFVDALGNIFTDANGVFEIGFVVPSNSTYGTAGMKTLLTTATLTEDIDGDGRLDINEDVNGNTIIDAGEDVDNDGKLDVNEDSNGNNRLDVNGRRKLEGQLEIIPKLSYSLLSNTITVRGEGFALVNPTTRYMSVRFRLEKLC